MPEAAPRAHSTQVVSPSKGATICTCLPSNAWPQADSKIVRVSWSMSAEFSMVQGSKMSTAHIDATCGLAIQCCYKLSTHEHNGRVRCGWC